MNRLTIEQALRSGAAQIESETPELDAQLLLGRATGRSRTSLFAWSDQLLSEEEQLTFERLLARRVSGEPVAHLTGRREFWSLSLAVTPATLIPRPDTECLVEQALALALPAQAQVLDLGTGTGAITLALASECPEWQLIGTDQCKGAVDLARANRHDLGLENVEFLISDWFSAVPPGPYDLIVSNPPYISRHDPHLERGDVRFEPASALVSGEDGLDALRLIIDQARSFLRKDGWLVLEHGYDQADAVGGLFAASGYRNLELRHDYGGQPRISQGQWPGLTEGEPRGG